MPSTISAPRSEISNIYMDQFQLTHASFCPRSTSCHIAILRVSELSPRLVPEPRQIHHASNPQTSAAQPMIPYHVLFDKDLSVIPLTPCTLGFRSCTAPKFPPSASCPSHRMSLIREM